MKNLVIVIGLFIFGFFVVNTFVNGDNNSLKSAATDVFTKANKAASAMEIVTD